MGLGALCARLLLLALTPSELVRPEPNPPAPAGADVTSCTLPMSGPSSPAPTVAPTLAQLHLYRQSSDGTIEELANGSVAGAGDLVQPGLETAGYVHAVLISFDGQGVVTLHHPDQPHETTLLPASPNAAQSVLPNHSFELDDAPIFERFVLVTAAESDIDVAQVLQAATLLSRAGPAARDRALALPGHLHQQSLLLRKQLAADRREAR